MFKVYNIHKKVPTAKMLLISGLIIDLDLLQTYGLIQLLFDIPWWSYSAGITLIEKSSVDPQFVKCPN